MPNKVPKNPLKNPDSILKDKTLPNIKRILRAELISFFEKKTPLPLKN
jgi:hypothetical protein